MDGIEPMVTMITTVGFPIAACCALFYLYDKTMNNVSMTLKELTDVMREVKEDLERRKEATA